MNREETIEKIYQTLIETGKVTAKSDILGVDPMEDKVFTKRLSVNKNLGEGANSIELVYVTVTSNDITFRDTTSADMRLNTKNVQDQWCNLFMDEATEEMLELVETAVCH
ncbi:MAG: hypothetical protein J6O49_19310 [Bacteroidaceae bacterium]|nr:hypothetical protein [Bacteroidaceae bacterium]